MGWPDDYPKIDFKERNLLNNKIDYLESISQQISELTKLVYQNANIAKKKNWNIINDKKISSYPLIRDILIDADFVALDSPWQFEMILKEAKDAIHSQITDFKMKIKKINDLNKDANSKWKGWV